MKDYLLSLINEIKLNDYKDVFLSAYDKTVNCERANALLRSYADNYKTSLRLDGKAMQNDLTTLANELGIPYQTLCSVFVFCLSKYLYKVYEKKKIDVEFLHDTLMDFNYKNKECLDAVGVPGTKTLTWHVKILNGEVIQIGRLQYERITAESDIKTTSFDVKKGQPLVGVHIPSSGKLDYVAVKESYARAKEYFSKTVDDVIFYCSSWLLWEGHSKILDGNSNIVKFCSDYELFERGVYRHDEGLRRVFPKDYTKPYKELPENNTLQKAYKKILLSGEKVGFGSGLTKI